MLDAPAGQLWQMLCFTQEQMTREQVDSSKLGDKYFFKPNDIGNPFCLSFCFFFLVLTVVVAYLRNEYRSTEIRCAHT